MNIDADYKSLKSYLFAIAYNMTGEVHEAEDLVQDSFEDALKKGHDHVRNVKSYLTRIVMNKAVDRLGQLKKEREHYHGVWLPEPYITTQEETKDGSDILPYAFLHFMEELNPIERAVFILRKAFEYSYEDIAELCGISVENCRQILHRIKPKIKQPAKGQAARQLDVSQNLLDEFIKACLKNDTSELSAFLREEVKLYSDGGGKAAAARNILVGIPKTVKFLHGIIRKEFGKWSLARPISVNGTPAYLVPDGQGVYMIFMPEFKDGKVLKIYQMRNPEKIILKNPSQNKGV